MRKREIERALKKYGDETVNLGMIQYSVENDWSVVFPQRPEAREQLEQQLRVIRFLRESVRLKTLRMFLIALEIVPRNLATRRMVDAVRRDLIAYFKIRSSETPTES